MRKATTTPRLVTRRKDLATRFWQKITRAGPDECWLWQASKTGAGYGHLRIDGQMKMAHRIAYEWTCGPIFDGQVVMHVCDVSACCNPRHLRLGTQKDNLYDMKMKGRKAPVLSEQIWTAKLDWDKVREIRRDNRPAAEIAKSYGVTAQTIRRVVRQECWSHV